MIKHKKVELTELFYDLVYVYVISQITGLIHHVHHGIVTPFAFFSFALGLIIFVNSWMVQTVYTNRFGSNSLTNILFMLVQMILLMIAATAISSEWENFTRVMLATVGISLILLLQYVVSYFQTDNPADKAFIKNFFYILGSRSALLVISVFLPFQYGLVLATVGILGSWALSGILGAFNHEVNAKATQLNFPHLIERMSLLIIITFGEMIVGIAPYFAKENLSIWSILIFFTVASLFMIYIVEIDHLIDVSQHELTGNRPIYFHYIILFGLSFVTVSLGFLRNPEANAHFTTVLLYLGIALILLGTLLHNDYNKKTHSLDRQIIAHLCILYLIGLVLSLLTSDKHLITVIVFADTLLMSIRLIAHNIKRTRKSMII